MNKMTKDCLYVEGSILDRVLKGEVIIKESPKELVRKSCKKFHAHETIKK